LNLKFATTLTKTNVIKVRVKLKTFGTAELECICYAMTLVLVPLEMSDKLSILFKLHHAK